MGLKEVISLIIFVLFLRGTYYFIMNQEENKCQMTYMFEYPEYVPIRLKPSLQKQFPKYNLYVYAEGDYSETLFNGQFTGIPILFIPGNAGSYKQVRSIGSVLLRMAESTRSPIHFNVFTVDFNEELSALFGGVLDDQTEFVVECIQHILSIYKQKGIDMKKVILYGHSMGGLISRGVFTDPKFNHQTVDTIFSLAAPHLGPVVNSDKFIHKYYQKVNWHWKSNISADGGRLDHVTIVSISGGDRDLIVRSDLAMINRLYNHENSSYAPTTVVASSVPGAWVSTDHLCIIWCKQLVLTTARLLFDMNSKKITVDKKHELVRFHMVRRTSSMKRFPAYPSPSIATFEHIANGFWRERIDKTWIFYRKMVVKHSHILVPLLKDGEMIIVTGFNIPKEDWIFACKATFSNDGRTKICTEGENLSSKTELIVPYEDIVRRRVQLNVSQLKAAMYTHVMVYSSLTNNMVEVIGERYMTNKRHIEFQITGGWDLLFAPQTILYSTAPKATFYNISLIGFQSLWQSYVVKVDSQSCQNTCKDARRGLVQFYVPWARDLKQAPLSCNQSTELLIKLMAPQSSNEDQQSSQLLLHLDPDCTYRVSIQVSFNGIMSQIARFYAAMIPSYIVANILLGLSAQLFTLATPGPCPDILSSLASCSPLNLVAIPSLLALILQPNGFLYTFFHVPIPYFDDVYLNEMALSFISLRPLIYMISYGAVFVSSWILTIFVIVWANCFKWIKSSNMMLLYIKDPLARIKSKWDVSMPSEKQLYHLSMFPVVISCLSIAVAYTTCGAFSLYVILSLQFFMLCNMCCDNRVLINRKGEHRFSTRWRLHLTLFQLWLFICLFNAPSLIHWAKNLGIHVKLVPDPALTTAVFSGISLTGILQLGVPTNYASSYLVSALFTYLASIITVIYGLVNIFRIPYIISSVLFIFCFQQIAEIILKKQTLILKQD